MTTEYQQQLNACLTKIKTRSTQYLGYPAGTNYDYSELYKFLDYTINNVGDPYVESYDIQTNHSNAKSSSFLRSYSTRRKTTGGDMSRTADQRASSSSRLNPQ